jgi:hypothetical protein
MYWARAAVLILVLIEAGWMAFDGSRALVVGDLITPRSGAIGSLWFVPLGTLFSLLLIVLLLGFRARF